VDKLLAHQRPWFDEWMRKTGEAPPDFGSLRSMPDLPDLLEFYDGKKVLDLASWAERREEIRALLCRYFLGTFPTSRPSLLRATVLHEERERGTIREQVRLDFDTRPPASVTIESMRPDSPGPHPVFLTPSTHRGWAVVGVSRGYLSVAYPSADDDDQSIQFGSIYPDCDWRTIPRRAWLAGLVIDYLEGVPGADAGRIAISGHSRNGKQALIAAAFDDRIGSVVSSSSGSSGATPYRFASEREFLESVECTTWMCPDWFHPRLRFFTGREDRLPIDIHGLLGLIAPRHALLSEALNDGCGNSFAVERSYAAATRVYDLYGKEAALAIRWRPGAHETCAEDIQSYFDWFEYSFGRGPCPVDRTFYHQFSWPEWRGRSSVGTPPPRIIDGSSREEAAATVAWFLGEEPPHCVDWGCTYGAEKDHDALLMNRLTVPDEVVRIPLQFSEYTAGCLYAPKEGTAGKPVIIWLHPFSFPTGYKGPYSVEHDTWLHYDPFIELPKAGYPVFAFDQLGFGRRLAEGRDFYARYPRWSKMGKMVRDVRAAVDYLRQGEGRAVFAMSGRFRAELPDLSRNPVICVGYSLGGTVALYAAAMDERISGVASFSGFTPMRTDTDAKPTGGIRRWWEWYGLLPRLGLYAGREGDLPYDFDDILSLIGPRDCLLVTPLHDRDADVEDVRGCVKRARRSWEAAGRLDRLAHQAPEDYSRFQPDQYRVLLDWLASLA
jgi:pimeloyl-ACP methyl ester carboxylesterase